MNPNQEAIEQLLNGLSGDLGLASRLASVSPQLEAWRAGDKVAGLVAADALDQLEGLVNDLVAELREFQRLLPALLGDLPEPPE